MKHRGEAQVRVNPLPSEERTTQKLLRTFTRRSRPESGLDCLTCAMFARRCSWASTPEEVLEVFDAHAPKLRRVEIRFLLLFFFITLKPRVE